MNIYIKEFKRPSQYLFNFVLSELGVQGTIVGKEEIKQIIIKNQVNKNEIEKNLKNIFIIILNILDAIHLILKLKKIHKQD